MNCSPLKALRTTSRKESNHEGHEEHEDGVRRAFESHDRLSLPEQHKKVRHDCEYRIDMLVENQLIVDLKRVEELGGIREAQRLTCRKLAEIKSVY